MYLYKLKIEGYRRLKNVELSVNDITFLIGQNNSGKSSVLKAIGHLLNNKQIPTEDFYSEMDEDRVESNIAVEKIVMEAEFRNVSSDSVNWRGFKGRTFTYESDSDTGILIKYKKEWYPGKAPIQYLDSYDRTLRSEFDSVNRIEDLINAGISREVILETFDKVEGSISGKLKEKLDYIDEVWEIGSSTSWFKNPGGIAGNVLSKLPRYLLIPADSGEDEISKSSGTLQKTLRELFKEVRDASPNYSQAQTFLNSLATELDPTDESSNFGKLLKDLNGVMSSVFPESLVHVEASLSNPDEVLIPQFTVEMESNIKTSVENQGTGMIRSAVFSLLRFRKIWEEQREENNDRGLIICFEEPEIFLHPSAANQMRNTIYDLVGGSSQIIASTHSPFMIDLSRKPKQNLVRFVKEDVGSKIINFSVSKAFKELQAEDKSYVKMVLKMDDYVSRAFFTDRTILVEGDTEDIVIRETIKRLSKDKYDYVRSNCEVIKGRGKPVLKSLVLYLKSLGIDPIVMHDSDEGVAGAEVHNEPIRLAIGNDNNLFVLNLCLENVLGYEPVGRAEKPYKAYRETLTWGESYEDVPVEWRTVFEGIMAIQN
jgi:putative ATP-dependent endonuclease of OLD family